MGIICKLKGHRPNRRGTWHDALDWRSDCKRCGVPMVKDGMIGQWRPFDRQRDFSVQRLGKPTRDEQRS